MFSWGRNLSSGAEFKLWSFWYPHTMPTWKRKRRTGRNIVCPHSPSPSIHAYKIDCVEQTNILKKKAHKRKILFHSTRRKTCSWPQTWEMCKSAHFSKHHFHWGISQKGYIVYLLCPNNTDESLTNIQKRQKTPRFQYIDELVISWIEYQSF